MRQKTDTLPTMESDRQTKSHIVYIAFGSNAGNRRVYIKKALAELKKSGRILQISKITETKPEGYTTQGRFLNGVLKFETKLTPSKLLKTLKKIEKSAGRKKTFENGPREIDLDIIFYENRIIKTKNLQIPHPRAHKRAFVMKPLCEIAPDLIHPNLNQSVRELCNETDK